MASDEGVEDMSSVVECLVNMFGGVINRDAIFTVVESCGGDLNLSADVIMNITSDTSQEDTENNKINTDDEAAGSVPQNAPLNPMPSSNNSMDVSCTKNMQPHPTTSSTNQQPSNSYAMQAAQQPASSNQMQIPPGFQGSESKSRTVPSNSFILPWTDQMKRIVEYHNEGSRVLIMMRGAPGCGKTYMARKLVEILLGSNTVNFKTFICSTDDFFCHRGNYYFNKQNLSDAHAWNQKRVRLAMQQGLSPIIVDNTNIEVWEMEFYVRNGVENGYYLEVVEPNTPWAKKPNQLAKKNVHGVPIQSIKRMVDNYIDGITGDSLLEYFKLKYPSEKKPPVLRTMPAFRPETSIKGYSKIYSTNNADTPNKLTSSQNVPITEVKKDEENKRSIVVNALPTQNMHENTGPVFQINQQVSLNPPEPEVEDKIVTSISKIVETPTNSENIAANNSNQYLELQKQLEEIEKVEQEWENGESWEEGQQEAAASNDKKIITSPKPPRTVSPTPESNSDGNLIEVVNNCQDWSQISLFMPPWTDQIPQSIDFVNPVVDKISNSTCMELGDFDYSRNSHKILSTSPRDINQFHIPFNRERIPDIRMLDKSTTTNEPWVTEKYRCKNEESHFIAFRKMFKDISRTALRDIFDQCMGDVNWAVEIVLDGVAANQFKTVDEEDLHDEDTDDQELCTCLSYYNIVPDTSTQSEVAPQQEEMIVTTEATIVAKKSSKRDVKTSDASLQLKRQIEQNVSIGDQHYSKHCLNLKKWRHGHSLADEEVVQDENQPSTSQGLQPNNRALACINISAEDQNSDDEESTVSEEPEKTINITLGKEFITVLDTLFGRADMVYPDNLSPRVNMPVSLLNEINALWMESLMHQLDEQERQCAKMMKEDEDLARVLAMKEAEMSTVGYKQPEVLDFKEILDMDYALSLYQKDVAEWKNKEPKDLAAKLTREKLYNLFPEVEKSLLDELLMAHENNFKNTVEVLLVSTGKASVLQEKDGVNTFVTQKEMERQQKVLEEERKALSEVEWPLLPTGEVPDMEVVNNHRDNAERHLKRRDQNIQKARDYLRRGMVSVGNYYRELAEGHRMKYEYANSLAAASLMQYHAANCPDNATLDLHYLRVGEAKESLDLFIDTHIQKLKTTQSQGPRVHTLFFITGRGLHSNGRPRIKPAVKKRLMERGLFCSEVNPGLLSTKVCADDRLTHQVA